VIAVEAQPAGQLRAELAGFGIDDLFASVLDGHASWREAVLCVRPERVGERLVPAELLELQRSS